MLLIKGENREQKRLTISERGQRLPEISRVREPDIKCQEQQKVGLSYRPRGQRESPSCGSPQRLGSRDCSEGLGSSSELLIAWMGKTLEAANRRIMKVELICQSWGS